MPIGKGYKKPRTSGMLKANIKGGKLVVKTIRRKAKKVGKY